MSKPNFPSQKILKRAYTLMFQAAQMTELYESKKQNTAKYVHATSRGHEAVQLACAMQLGPQDFAFPYYRDDAFLLGIGMRPYDLMLQLLAKKEDPFSGGRTYYAHPSLRDEDKTKIPHQSSATGMQAIPATGAAMGLQYREQVLGESQKMAPLVVCSLGDASVTEGEISEAFQMAALKQLPILYLVQDNEWDISATAKETRAQNAYEYAKGFYGLEAVSIDGTDFYESFITLQTTLKKIRKERRPFLIHAKVPLLNHHTSGVRMEWYRDDLENHKKRDPLPKLKEALRSSGASDKEITAIEAAAKQTVSEDYQTALLAEDPKPEDLFTHDYAPSIIKSEQGIRSPEINQETLMVDCALHALEEIMTDDPQTLLYGQDVGGRLGGVFREAATLAQKFGDNRVFNTPIQEAFIIGSTVGMSAVGLKPIVEVQFADYIWPGLNQLFTEVSRSCYLSDGKWPVNMILRVPIGAYGSGGPYHSSSVETIVANIRGVKIAYPSNGADLKGLLKSAYHDPNPVIIFEHKGLYWSKVPGTDSARVVEPDANYVLPFGNGNIVLEARDAANAMSIITYGMGVHWASNAAKDFGGKIEIVDLRTINPLDETLIFNSVKKTGKCMVLSEEPKSNSFALSLAGLIQENCFEYLDAPIKVIGSESLPAIPLNTILEQTMIPSVKKVKNAIQSLLDY